MYERFLSIHSKKPLALIGMPDCGGTEIHVYRRHHKVVPHSLFFPRPPRTLQKEFLNF